MVFKTEEDLKKDKKNTFKKVGKVVVFISVVVGIAVGIKQLFWKDDEKTTQNIGKIDGVNVQGNGNTVNFNTTISQPEKTVVTSTGTPNSTRESLPASKKNTDTDTSRNTRILVLPFEHLSNASEYSWLSIGIAESLISSFSATNKYDVVERTQRDKLLKEIDFQNSKYVDENTAARLGKMLGTDQTIIGSYQIDQGNIRILTRIVHTESGKIVRSSVIEHAGLVSNIFQVEKELSDKLLKYLSEQ